MGLDFYLWWIKKSDGPVREQMRNWKLEDLDLHELAYGRKSWELVLFLGCPTSDDCVGELQLETWVDLMERLSWISPYLDEIREAICFGGIPQKREEELMNLYQEWYDKNFDEYPTLGYDFSTGYMQTFWEAADTVLQYLEDPDYEVWMEANY